MTKTKWVYAKGSWAAVGAPPSTPLQRAVQTLTARLTRVLLKVETRARALRELDDLREQTDRLAMRMGLIPASAQCFLTPDGTVIVSQPSRNERQEFAACQPYFRLTPPQREEITAEIQQLRSGFDAQSWPEQQNRTARIGELERQLASDRFGRRLGE